MIVVLFGLVALVAATVVYIIVGLIANNRKLNDKASDANRRLGFLEGELRTQARVGEYADMRMADEVLRSYEAHFRN